MLALPQIIFAVATASEPATYYVRPDGGSAAQCDGRHDAPLAADRACAWRHPFEALPPDGPSRIAGGDTLVIASGSYRMGTGAPGTDALKKCRADWPWDCHAAAIPSGPSPDRPTRIVGAGFDSGCAKPPELWGTQHASTVLDLSGSSNVEIACLEITDHSGCIEFHNAPGATKRCERDHAPYGDWASVGIAAVDSANVRLSDLDIHGLAHDGVRAAGLRDWTLQRVRIVGNGWSGWNGDIGKDAPDSGRMIFRDVEIAWNGCAESWPDRHRSDCWGQTSGGYGDGLGTGDTGGEWLFEHVDAHHNTQDGIDLLHANRAARVVFRDVHTEANAGNQLKASGSVTIENSSVRGNCGALTQDGLDEGDACRAMGNSISINLAPRDQVRIAGNSIEGEGDCLVGLQCAGDSCDGAQAVVTDNRLRGSARASKLPCSLWIAPELRAARVEFSGNQVRAVRNADCPERASCGKKNVQVAR